MRPSLTLANAAKLVRDNPALAKNPDIIACLKRLEIELSEAETQEEWLNRLVGE